jgi:hypothetical protein
MIETLFSVNPSPRWPDELERITEMPRREPFAADVVALVEAISARLLTSEEVRRHPELAALGYWFRPARLRALSTRLANNADRARVRARGLVFAIAPSNVDVLFIYGWLLSLLAGNATVVRVSGKPSPVRELFLRFMRELAQEPSRAAPLADSWIIHFEHDSANNRAISAICHARLVWGGDRTVAEIHAIPLNPLALDVGFADRFSMAALDSAAVGCLSELALRKLARRFVNDTLWFDQQACSSPRAVIWIGTGETTASAKSRFWKAYRAAAVDFADDPSRVMARVTDLFALAAAGCIERLASRPAARPAIAIGTRTLDAVREIHSGHGLFVEYLVADVEEIASFVRAKDQTLVAYGLKREDLDRLVEILPSRAIDRIVAPGQANEFSTIWDGTDILDVLTRKIGFSA